MIKILMVDDHPITLDGYQNILNNYKSEDLELEIETAGSCEEAFNKIKYAQNSGSFDIAFLDISLPPFEAENILSGEDIGLRLRELAPSTKIVILTMYNENHRIYNILKNVNPDGLLIKSDVSPQEFFTAFAKIIAGKIYYSDTVNQSIKRQFSKNISVDDLDRNILYHLSKGLKTKDLIDVIPLSLAAIEKRKKNLKENLEIKGGDLILIEKAKELGFI